MRKPKALPKQPKKASWGDIGHATADTLTQAPAGALSIARAIPGAAEAALNYVRTSTPGEVWDDTKGAAGAAWEAVKEDPGQFAFDAMPFLGDLKMYGDLIKESAQLRAEGNPEAARALAGYALPITAATLLPDLGAAKLLKRPAQETAEEMAARLGRPVYDVAEEGPFLNVQRRGVEPQIIPEARGADIDTLRGILRNPETNPAARSANEYNLEELGQRYHADLPAPGTGLQKQGGIARAFQLAAEENPAYKHAIFERYGEMYPGIVESTRAQNYDQLTEAAYNALADKTVQQFDRIPLSMRYHFGEGEYPTPSAMLQDVMGQGNLNVFRGGDPHPYLSRKDPLTGLTANEMFRAAHDFYGHGPQGSTFRPGGEEMAYASHSAMMDPLEQFALAAETRGQNSWVNYGPANADLTLAMNTLRDEADVLKKLPRDSFAFKARGGTDRLRQINVELRELGGQTQFAPQTPLLLPPEYLDPATKGGVPSYLRDLIVPRSGSGDMRAVHLSTTPGLTATDPAFYGTGHRGDDWGMRGRKGSPSEHTSFYLGDNVIPEPEVAAIAPHAYETKLSNLYNIAEDPDRLVQLARAYNVPQARAGAEGAHLPDLTRLISEYGFDGYMNPNFMGEGRGAANVFKPVEGLKPIERGPQGYAEGGVVRVKVPGYAKGGKVSIKLPGNC